MSALSVRGLGKRFTHRLPRYRTVIGRLRAAFSGEPAALTAWALRGVSFDAARGECVGLMGPNGSGKTTLLRLIAGILEPTEGAVAVYGRANAFLSLGAGAQPELSVADNLEILGILNGLSRREALARRPAMLDFAGLAGLAEVRLGELSAGQAARAAFAAAIHADLDLLLVDEALAVGDAAFQEKCGEAFARLRREGKTLIVASHDEGLLAALGARVLRLEGGRLPEPEPAAVQ